MKNWKIGTRIIAGFSAVIVITMLLGVFSYFRVLAIEASEFDLIRNYMPSIKALSSVQKDVDTQLVILLKHADSHDNAEMAAVESDLAESRTRIAKAMTTYESFPASDDEKAIYAHVKEARVAFLQNSEEMLKVSRIGTKVANAKAKQILDYQVRPAKTKLVSAIQDLIDYNFKGADAGAVLITTCVAATKHVVLIGVGMAILFAIPIAFYIVRSITAPMAKTVIALEQLGDCDLTATLEYESQDEIGQMARSLNATIARLRTTMSEVSKSASNANNSATELSVAADAIATGSQQQAASLEETSASLEEITATLRQSVDNTRQANQLALTSRESAEQGQQAATNAVDAMGEINAASSKISDIISTIDEIAFQTNLLAVNAAVEAARAGDQGRGFAVVAAEVRSLAQRSAGAAKEIKALIQDTLHKVERGTGLVNKSGETLKSIVGSVKRVTDIIGEISAASDEQSTGVDQVNTAMTQIDHVTQSNAAQTEELSATAQILATQSEHLLSLISVFKFESDGATLHAAVSAAPVKTGPRSIATASKSTKPFRKAAPVRSAMGSSTGVLQPVGAVAAGHSGADSFEEF